MNSLNNLFNLNKKSGRGESSLIERDVTTVGPLDKRETMCAILAPVLSDKNMAAIMLNAFMAIREHKLEGQLSKCYMDLDNFWSQVEEYKRFSEDELDEMVNQSQKQRERNMFGVVQRILWELGSGMIKIPLTLEEYDSSHLPDMAKEALGNARVIITNAEALKWKFLGNAIDSLIKCFPLKIQSGLNTLNSRKSFIEELIPKFVRGESIGMFSVEKYRPPKESGALLPHTLSPKEWLSCAVSDLIEREFGSTVLVVFYNADPSSIRRLSESKYLLAKHEDGETPYDMECNPAIYCNDTIIQEDGSEVWAWRGDVDIINSEVNAVVLKERNITSDNREKHRARISREYALRYVSSGDSVTENGCVGNFSDTLKVKTGKEFYFRFFKQGLSKKNQVKDHPNFIHVVSDGVASQMNRSEYFAITLPDLNSTVLIPMMIWDQSAYSQSKKKRSKYTSSYGLERVVTNSNPYLPFMAFYGLAQIDAMFDALKRGIAYSYEDVRDEIMTVAINSKSVHPELFGSTTKDLQSRLNMLGVYFSVYPGTNVGLIIAPENNKIGKQSKDKVSNNVGFEHGFSEYGKASMSKYTYKGFSMNTSIEGGDGPEYDEDSTRESEESGDNDFYGDDEKDSHKKEGRNALLVMDSQFSDN